MYRFAQNPLDNVQSNQFWSSLRKFNVVDYLVVNAFISFTNLILTSTWITLHFLPIIIACEGIFGCGNTCVVVTWIVSILWYCSNNYLYSIIDRVPKYIQCRLQLLWNSFWMTSYFSPIIVITFLMGKSIRLLTILIFLGSFMYCSYEKENSVDSEKPSNECKSKKSNESHTGFFSSIIHNVTF